MSALSGLDVELCRHYDVALLDLDGVVYVAAQAIDSAPPALAAARSAGMRLAFVTNNAARPPQAVAELLSSLGVPAGREEVITSSQAAAHHLARMLPGGARVLVIGTDGLTEALRERGLTPVHSADDDPVAVVQGFSPTMDWPLLAEGSIAIRRGLPWVATNLDTTVPSPRGPVLGNGSLVAALRTATGAEPTSTGKPDPTMHRETVERSRARNPLVVGDRLDTDIEGANRAGCDSLLVLTGVTDARQLIAAEPPLRPTYVAADLSGLLRTAPAVEVADGTWSCGSARVRRAGSRVVVSVATGREPIDAADDGVSGETASGRHAMDVLRAVSVCTWSRPAGGEPNVESADDTAAAALEHLRLS